VWRGVGSADELDGIDGVHHEGVVVALGGLLEVAVDVDAEVEIASSASTSAHRRWQFCWGSSKVMKNGGWRARETRGRGVMEAGAIVLGDSHAGLGRHYDALVGGGWVIVGLYRTETVICSGRACVSSMSLAPHS
jgi:hypothetical protein